METSAWRNDPELSLIRESSDNAVGDKYNIYQCGMYRKFDDDVSAMRLKTGAEIPWIFGYKVYETLGRFQVAIQDGGNGTLKLIESV